MVDTSWWFVLLFQKRKSNENLETSYFVITVSVVIIALWIINFLIRQIHIKRSIVNNLLQMDVNGFQIKFSINSTRRTNYSHLYLCNYTAQQNSLKLDNCCIARNFTVVTKTKSLNSHVLLEFAASFDILEEEPLWFSMTNRTKKLFCILETV